ncbi:D-lactate dehydrogenase [Stenotrophomonas maltophilia]|uniref:Quinone-dependent D-lactate dehydrogenase n=1 Tax=Stenotrophomonas riyadhensis TaxID=2859893 RepID=A0ABT2XM03_9GAMM|nr:D-lactate dehydrogenase [Stenotrophomonas sp. CFS3442]MBH1619820.1 D-lactate dehydrogenase [Stenotrophomonas maltophilia]MCV0326944.1 D-lactate dehydrogenase [Stenotrophomonas sp. CFS3442]HEL4246375.1 D-lactate dehydrogenase [Stenotrophomonas maltophilia]
MSGHDAVLAQLRAAVGSRHVLTGDKATRRFRRGYRFGDGPVLAVVRPGTLLELWRVLQAAVQGGAAIILQAANTGLTGGSTPDGNDYGRPIVLVSTLRLTGIQLLNEGRQVLCLPGATLDRLEQTLAPLGREPHSVIGSSCIGASVLGGICNNSGGALVRRGPAYTELALYAQVDAQGQLQLVNHLGIALGDTPEQILQRLQAGDYRAADVSDGGGRAASDPRYAEEVRRVDADTPARFNADPSRHFEAAGSAGKLAVFAVRLDTFEKEAAEVFYIGSNSTDSLTAIRRQLLTGFERLPIAGEYIHRDAYDIGERYGKDSFLLIDRLGTARVPAAFALKSRVDGWFERLGLRGVTDRVMQVLTGLLPSHLPKRMGEFRQRYEHHLLLKVSAQDAADTEAWLRGFFADHEGGYFHCTADEGRKAFLHRFAVAGAAVRYREVHRNQVQDIVALDIALRRDDADWFEQLPADIDGRLLHKLYYGHFLCHVFHQDYIARKGEDPMAIEHAMWALLDQRGAEYPAEHNVGHLYPAKPALAGFYKQLDPSNTFNPGIGQTSKARGWGGCDCSGH